MQPYIHKGGDTDTPNQGTEPFSHICFSKIKKGQILVFYSCSCGATYLRMGPGRCCSPSSWFLNIITFSLSPKLWSLRPIKYRSSLIELCRFVNQTWKRLAQKNRTLKTRHPNHANRYTAEFTTSGYPNMGNTPLDKTYGTHNAVSSFIIIGNTISRRTRNACSREKPSSLTLSNFRRQLSSTSGIMWSSITYQKKTHI